VPPPNKTGSLDDPAEFTVAVKAGEFIFREGDAGKDMFLIREGQVKLAKHYAGQERQVELLEPGDFFGEMSLIDEQPRELSAQAVSDAELFRIDPSTFDLLIQEAPEIPIRMLQKLGRRLREHQEHEARAAAIAMGPLDPSPSDTSARPRRVALRKLACLFIPGSHTRFDLAAQGESVVGRFDRSTGFTPDLDLTTLDTDRTIGRRHAKIVSRNGEYFVREETPTRNGTFVNDARVQTGVDQRLENGDRVRFGFVEMTFELRDRPVAE
jgi:CRP-like cAMP-binding protein